MSADCIRFDDERQVFSFDNQAFRFGTDAIRVAFGAVYVDEPEQREHCQPITAAFLGEVVATALMNGTNLVQFDTVSVTVNYLVEMLRIVGKEGKFYDCLSTTHDHAFNNNTPTPGPAWMEARLLLAEARELENYARLACVANYHDEAEAAESNARACRRRALRARQR